MRRRPLPRLPLDLIRRAEDPSAVPPYRTVRDKATDGRLPTAEPGPNGRWTYDPEALPEIANALGVRLRASAPAELAA